METSNSNKKKVHFFENLSYFYQIIKEKRGYFYLLLGLSVFVELLMIADNLLIKLLVDYGQGFLEGDYLKEQVLGIFVIILSVFFGLVIFRSSIRFFQLHFKNKLMAYVDLNIKNRYFNKIIGLDYDFHTTHKSGDMISKLSRGSQASVELTELATSRVFSPFIGLLVVLFSIGYFDLIPALITMGTGLIIIVVSWAIFSNQARTKLEDNKNSDNEKGFVSNVLGNFESIKLFGKEKTITDKHQVFINKSRESFLKFNNYYRGYASFMSFILGISTILILYFSLKSFLDGKISLGTIVFIFTTYGRMITPIVSLSDSLRSFNQSVSDLQSLFYYDKVKNSIKDSQNAVDLEVKGGEIEFRNVNFSYGKKKIFDNFNLKIKPKEKIAIVGASGEGKTSLIRLLFRLYDVDSGQILIDGKDLKKVKQDSLRNQLSVVPQEPILFHDSIYNNIKFSKPSSSLSDVLEVIKLSSSDDFVKKLPNKERTLVGERGIRLSGGEKQRIAIARALLADKKIIVLDEPTSSLDLETEHKIQQSIKKLLEGKTSIIIAHRLSTIKNVDRILVLKAGKIVEQGKHDDLLRKNGEYAKLWKYTKQDTAKNKISQI